MKNEIIVSVCCTVYNHGKYLRQCLDSILMQETNFNYEILIHDDASTDNSQEIISEYEKNYPDIVKPIYQTENQYSQHKKIAWTYQYPRAKGKYIALCEGDDYWSDKHKLQKQYDILESHPDCVFCTHTVQRVKENGNPEGGFYPPFEIKESVLTKEEWIKYICCKDHYPFQTSSYFFLTESIKKYLVKMPRFINVAKTGDITLMFLLATEGNCFYIKKTMSCYRVFSENSWSSKEKNNSSSKIDRLKAQVKSMRCYDCFTDYKYSAFIQKEINRCEFSIYSLQGNFNKCLKKKYRTQLNRYPLKSKIYFTVCAIFPWLRPIYLRIRYNK